MRFSCLLLIIITLFISKASYTQNQNCFSPFTNRSFYKPFVSEISSTLINISTGDAKSTLVTNAKRKAILTEIHLGVDLPLLYGTTQNFKWAMSAPISLHVLWAPFEKTTAPIINNDYRFGLSFTGITYLNNSYVKNLSFKFTPIAHESTHLGDEITLYGYQNLDNFYRVNVSYEYYELGLTLNDPDTLTGNLLSLRLGFIGLLNPDKGYYSFYENEIGDRTFFPSKRWAEYYFQLNYKKTDGPLASKTWHPSFSIEARNRVKYEYENENEAKRVWCLNTFIGYDYVPKNASNIKSVGHYIRFYRGLNPHGQFRDFYYRFVGYSMVVYL